ncbi:MAG: hypothetical protein IKK83_01765 [Clostridia bacterium]|nr:hypothetical protein [Clostridia bacterium]
MKAKELYDLATNLLGVRSIDDGDHPDCADYLNRAPDLIGVLTAETLYLDRWLKKDSEVRAVYIESLEDELTQDERLCYGVLPYGLAALLIADEDTAIYKLMREHYLLAIRRLEETVTGRAHPIEDCYRYHG